MKKINSKANSFIAKTLATSVLFASCTQNADIEQLVDNSSNESDRDVVDSKGVPISLSLSEEAKQSLREITPLVQEIIANPEIAQELSKDPKGFCEKRGYGFTFDLDDAIFKVIVALGNSDINEALNKNDFERFMQLCAEMNLLDENQKVKLNTVFQSKEEQEIFNSIAHQMNGEVIESRSVALWFAISVVVVIAIILTYTVGIDENESQERMVAYEAFPDEQDTINNQTTKDIVAYRNPQKSQVFLRCSNPNFSILDIWALKDKQINSYQLVSGYKTFLAQQIVSYLKTNKPNVFENFSEIQISEFLKKNMIV